MSDPLDKYRTIRLEMFSVWENGGGEFPLFVTSDGSVIGSHLARHPEDTVTREYWTQEGGR